MPPIAARNFELAKQTADRALAACDKLYKEPDGCFFYLPGETYEDAAPAIAIGDYWTGEKADIDYLQARCTWKADVFRKRFPAVKLDAGSTNMNCSFRPYPTVPPTLNPGDPPCSTQAPYPGWTFLQDGRDGEVVKVPLQAECKGAWEAMEVRRVAADGSYEVTVDVWLKSLRAPR